VSLVVRGVHKRLAGREVLRDVGFEVPEGSALALLGANGAGKSTLLRLLAGVLAADAGVATLDGASLFEANAALRGRVGYVPEHPDALPHLTVRELLRLVGALKRTPVPDDATLERLGAAALLDQRTHALSLGQRRRAFLAAALVGTPRLLLLDEPTNGLDPGGVEMLGGVLRDAVAGGAVVVLATHDLAFARVLTGRTLTLSYP
jgi:ABC-2 type transport system ATP-binding protein